MSTTPVNPGTTPLDWEALLSMIQSMLPIEVDLHELEIDTMEKLLAYMEANGWEPVYTMRQVITSWAQVGAANAADSTNIAVRPVTDLVPATGGVTAAELLAGRGTIGKVAKGIIVTACMALFVSSLTPLASQEELEEAVTETVDDFTIDGENVLVYIDPNGKTHLQEELLQAVRETMIHRGVYSSEGITIVYPSTFPELKWQLPIKPLNIPFTFPNTVYNWDITITRTFDNFTNDSPVYAFYVPWYSGSTKALQIVMVSRSPFTFDDIRYPRGGTDHRSSSTYSWGTQYPPEEGNFYYYETQGSNATPAGQWDAPETVTLIPAGSSSLTPDSIRQIAYIAFNGSYEGGVEGVDVTDKTDIGDLTKTLEQAITELANKGVTLANPTDEDIFNKDNWYPVDLNDFNAFEDGLTSDQTDPDAITDGDTDDATKNKILEDLADLIRNITGNPDLPDVPAGDSGDTPPAEPPVLDGSSNGLWTIYNPTKQEVQSFGAWLWSSSIIDQIVRQFNSPIDAIIGFHQIYCTPSTGSSKIIKAGYLDSPVSALEVTNQYAEIDCGEVHVDEYYGNALDYDNTQVSIYLPFIGIVPLNTNIVMGSTLEVIYRIDVFTGTCLAQIKVKKQNSNAVMYAFEGNCAVQIPLTATTYTGMVGALISGLSAGVSFMAGDMVHATTAGISAAMSAMGGQTGTKQSGSMGSNAGALGIRKPYIIITRAVSAMPAGFENLAGLPSTELVALSSVSGYTVVRNVHLEGVPGTAEELEEIKGLLESGVIF